MIQPILDYLIVEKTEEQLPGGLVLSQPADPLAPRHAKIIAMGEGRTSETTGKLLPIPRELKVGVTILMHGGAGTRLKIEQKEYWAIFPRDVIGIQP